MAGQCPQRGATPSTFCTDLVYVFAPGHVKRGGATEYSKRGDAGPTRQALLSNMQEHLDMEHYALPSSVYSMLGRTGPSEVQILD